MTCPYGIFGNHKVSGRREGTRNAGTRDAIIDDRGALLQVGSTLMTCPYGVSGNHTVNGRSWGFNVSDPRSWWYIPESGIYHQSKLTRKEAGPAIRRRKEAAAPARPDRSRRVNCGNDEGSQPPHYA